MTPPAAGRPFDPVVRLVDSDYVEARMDDVIPEGRRFISPGVKPGPYTECYACGAWRNEHGPQGECPAREESTDG